jgi:hypothetical protein
MQVPKENSLYKIVLRSREQTEYTLHCASHKCYRLHTKLVYVPQMMLYILHAPIRLAMCES